MGWSFSGHRGSANNKTSGLGIAVSPTQIIPVGAIVVVPAISDNIGTVSSTNNHVLCDTKQNVWQKIGERSNAAAAGAGITLSLWVSQLTTALQTTDSIILGLTAAATAKALGIYEYAVGAGNLFRVVNVASSEQDATAAPTVTLSGLTSNPYALFGVVAREDDTAGTYTQDADYNDRTKFGTTGSTGNTNVSAIFGDRLATLTGDTFAPTGLSIAADVVTALFALEEITPFNLTVTAVVQASGKVFVSFGKRTIEFTSLAHAQSFAAFSRDEGELIMTRMAIARYLSLDPTAQNPSMIEGHTIRYTPGLNRMVEVS